MLRCCRHLLLILLIAQLFLPGQQSRAEAPASLSFHATGHRLSDEHGFLSFWETHGGEPILGRPITEPFMSAGRIVQYLERSRLEYHPQLDAVLLGRLGAERTSWRTFSAAPPTLPSSDTLRFSQTGHTLAPPFRAFWERHGGTVAFGYPISEPLWEAVGGSFFRVQYFERARLEYHPAFRKEQLQIRVSELGLEIARAQGLIATMPDSHAGPAALSRPAAQRQDAPATQPRAAFTPTPSLAPTSVPTAAVVSQSLDKTHTGGPKSIVVDLSKQWLYAYKGQQQVFAAPIATGKDGFNTPVGQFAVYAKVPLQTMRGTLNGESWAVPDVPHILYIYGDIALHGTYWHNLFGSGTRISHGCINLPLREAAWLYEWATVGTPVTVRY